MGSDPGRHLSGCRPVLLPSIAVDGNRGRLHPIAAKGAAAHDFHGGDLGYEAHQFQILKVHSFHVQLLTHVVDPGVIPSDRTGRPSARQRVLGGVRTKGDKKKSNLVTRVRGWPLSGGHGVLANRAGGHGGSML